LARISVTVFSPPPMPPAARPVAFCCCGRDYPARATADDLEMNGK
jgi:hypothetical protein